MIEAHAAWKAIKLNAQKALSTSMVYHSIIEKRAYKVIALEEDKITIARLSGGANDELSKNIVFKAIDKFNKTRGKIKRRTLLSPTVAKETALVLFCPYLSWSEDGNYIIET
jgi:predicted nucleotide-binding protein (sugar kinase/HSP70/actin superfamily)